MHVFGDWVLTRQKSVLHVESGVEQIQPVEFAKHGIIQNVVDGHGIVGMFGGNLFKESLRGGVIEIVEVLIGRLNLRRKIQRIRVGTVGSLDCSECRQDEIG